MIQEHDTASMAMEERLADNERLLFGQRRAPIAEAFANKHCSNADGASSGS
jgi:hypothetical protein